MGRIRDVSEIIEITKSHKASPDRMAVKVIIKKIDRAIRFRAENRHEDASIQIPAIIVSIPDYDRKVVTKNVFEHYSDIGFKCCRDVDGDMYKLYISWGNQEDSDVSEGSESEDESIEMINEEPEQEEPRREKKTIVLSKESLASRVKKLS